MTTRFVHHQRKKCTRDIIFLFALLLISIANAYCSPTTKSRDPSSSGFPRSTDTIDTITVGLKKVFKIGPSILKTPYTNQPSPNYETKTPSGPIQNQQRSDSASSSSLTVGQCHSFHRVLHYQQNVIIHLFPREIFQSIQPQVPAHMRQPGQSPYKLLPPLTKIQRGRQHSQHERLILKYLGHYLTDGITDKGDQYYILYKAPLGYTLQELIDHQVLNGKSQIEHMRFMMNKAIYDDRSQNCIYYQYQSYDNFLFEARGNAPDSSTLQRSDSSKKTSNNNEALVFSAHNFNYAHAILPIPATEVVKLLPDILGQPSLWHFATIEETMEFRKKTQSILGLGKTSLFGIGSKSKGKNIMDTVGTGKCPNHPLGAMHSFDIMLKSFHGRFKQFLGSLSLPSSSSLRMSRSLSGSGSLPASVDATKKRASDEKGKQKISEI